MVAGVLQAAHAADQFERVAVEATIFQVSVVEVDGDDFSDDEAGAVGGGGEFDDLAELAFEADGRFCDAGGAYEFGGRGSEVGQPEFVDGRIVLATGDVHLLQQFVGDDADYELFGLVDIAESVFHLHLTGLDGAHGGREGEQGRVDADAIEKGEWGEVGVSSGAERRYPGNGARSDGA